MGTNYYQKRKEDAEFSLWSKYREYSHQALIDLLSSQNSLEIYTAARELQTRGDKSTFKAALHLIQDANYLLRGVSAFILGQIKCSPKDEKLAVHLLCERATEDKSATVRSNAVAALGHICVRTKIYNSTVIQRLKITTYDQSPHVRLSTAFALFSIDELETEGLLLMLIKDKDLDVIDWALFSINNLGYNSKKIRDIMFEYLPNQHEGIKMEAITGLAERKDKRVIPFLKEELKQNRIYDYALESIIALGDKSLLPSVEAILPQFEDDPLVNEVITKLKER